MLGKYKVGDQVTQNHPFYAGQVLTLVRVYVDQDLPGNSIHIAQDVSGKECMWSESFFTGIVKRKANKAHLPEWW